MPFKASVRLVQGGEGSFVASGLLVLDGADIHLFPLPGAELAAQAFNAECSAGLQTLSAASLFTYYTERGNGYTEDWSLPFNIEGKTVEEAAAATIARLLKQTS